MKKILVIHGPNLHLLGRREPEVYGRVTLKRINEMVKQKAKERKVSVAFVQSNHEGEIVDAIGGASANFDGLLINPAAYTHTSIAIRDALAAAGIPVVEVHLSNIYAREEFRRKSLVSGVVKGAVFGFGPKSYILGLDALVDLLENTS
jgi:3-dehydroquinate dehydratase II